MLTVAHTAKEQKNKWFEMGEVLATCCCCKIIGPTANKGMSPCCQEAKPCHASGRVKAVRLTHECWRAKPGIQMVLSSVFSKH